MNPQRSKLIKRKWIWVLSLLAICKGMSYAPVWVEAYYTHGLFPVFSYLQRVLLGWVPFSLGDLLYFLTGLWICWALFRFFKKWFSGELNRSWWLKAGWKLLFRAAWVYVLFYGLWGLNYSRMGITHQFDLKIDSFAQADLDTLVGVLHNRLNLTSHQLKASERTEVLSKNYVFKQGAEGFRRLSNQIGGFALRHPSVKPSLYGFIMNYSGVQGYYNPFTGEAQVNTTIPPFVQPFIVTHEMAHQLGYAKESEANFIGFLASKDHPSVHFRYAALFAMYAYGRSELYGMDSLKVRHYDSTLTPQVQKDFKQYRAFYQKYENQIEPIISWVYGNYLKANDQPAGNRSYDEVVLWLIAWYKKNGLTAL